MDHVLYNVDVCTFGRRGITGSQLSLRTRFQGLFFGARAPVARTRWMAAPAPNEDCLINNNQAPFNPEFQVGTFYQIFGVVVQLSGPGQTDFWIRTDPTTGRPQRVNFSAGGSAEFAEFVGDPPSLPVVIDEPDICEGVPAWQRGTRYRRGDQVVFRNFLFTRVRRGWRRERECG